MIGVQLFITVDSLLKTTSIKGLIQAVKPSFFCIFMPEFE